jgi:hypothetical protein
MDWSRPRKPALRPAAFFEPPDARQGAADRAGLVREIKHDGYPLMVGRES